MFRLSLTLPFLRHCPVEILTCTTGIWILYTMKKENNSIPSSLKYLYIRDEQKSISKRGPALQRSSCALSGSLCMLTTTLYEQVRSLCSTLYTLYFSSCTFSSSFIYFRTRLFILCVIFNWLSWNNFHFRLPGFPSPLAPSCLRVWPYMEFCGCD